MLDPCGQALPPYTQLPGEPVCCRWELPGAPLSWSAVGLQDTTAGFSICRMGLFQVFVLVGVGAAGWAGNGGNRCRAFIRAGPRARDRTLLRKSVGAADWILVRRTEGAVWRTSGLLLWRTQGSSDWNLGWIHLRAAEAISCGNLRVWILSGPACIVVVLLFSAAAKWISCRVHWEFSGPGLLLGAASLQRTRLWTSVKRRQSDKNLLTPC